MLGLLVYLLLPAFTFIFSSEAIIVFSLYSIPAYSTFFVVAPVLITEITDEDKRGFSMGLYSAFAYCGQATGTMMGAIFAHYSGIIKYNFGIASIVALFSLLIGKIFLRDGLEHDLVK